MPVGWTFAGEPSGFGEQGGPVTLVEGAAFCVCGRNGDIRPGVPHGLFFRDTRLLSSWQLLLDDEPPEVLTTVPGAPYETTFVARARPREGRADSTLLVLRQRYVGRGMREDVVLQNLGAEAVVCRLAIEAEADFADLFEVKENRVRHHGAHQSHAGDDGLRFERRREGDVRGVRVVAEGWAAESPGRLVQEVVVPARGEWCSSVQVLPSVDGVESAPYYPSGMAVEHAEPARRLRDWRRATPVLRTTDHGLGNLFRRSGEDLAALRIIDPGDPTQMAVAAGAPWFMTVFGRDSLLTAWMALLLDPGLALGTLHTLARLQGTKVDPRSDEEPGRILHEVRHGMDSRSALGGGSVYYGSIDATPLFVMLLGEVRRWGVDAEQVVALLPAADRAIDWIERYGDRDGDGFVEYQRGSDQGLVNQGWKDSFDGITFADGRIAEPPLALAEVQGYTYAAYLARAEIARGLGDAATAERCAGKAAALRTAFNRDFWLPDRGWFAVALDRDKRLVDSLASNMGHCLWTGIVDDDKASLVAERLLGPEMFTGWGVRTLASTMGAYNPMSYHNGSVWPHDNAVVAAGLMRYGFVAEAQRVTRGILDAGAAFAGRLPELFCGFDRAAFDQPIPYPTSCSPQAWAAASPLLLLRSLLGLDPDVPAGALRVAPALMPELAGLGLDNLPLAGTRIGLSTSSGPVAVSGLPPGLAVVRETPAGGPTGAGALPAR